MKTVIIDDEPLAIVFLQEELGKIPFVQVVATFSSPIMAMSFLQKNSIDLVFSDISMPDISGLQLIKAAHGKSMFILATAHREYAVEGFELNVVDYLVKPYSFDRLLQAVLKAQELYILKQPEPEKTPSPIDVPVTIEHNVTHFFVKSDYKDVKIDFAHITYISALKDYIKIFVEGSDKAIITQMNLKAVEDMLPEAMFCRVHRSYIVNIQKVNAHNRTELFIGKVEIPVGDLYRSHFIKKLKGDL